MMPGQQTDIAIERAFKTIMPKPYSNCEIGADSPKHGYSALYDLIASTKYEYNQQLCFEQCFQSVSIKECNCTTGFIKSLFAHAEPCNTFARYNCTLHVYTHMYLLDDFIQKVCEPLCPLECNVTEYKMSTTFNKLIGDLYVDDIVLNRNLSSDFGSKVIDSNMVRESVVSINMFYNSLSYTLSSESPQMDLVSLLANIGGNLGLFLGVSLLSASEIVELAIEVVFILIRKKASSV